MRPNVLAVAVDCYAGDRGDETPHRVTCGDQLVEILAVVDQWRTPDHRYFKVRTAADETCTLRQDVQSGGWGADGVGAERPQTRRRFACYTVAHPPPYNRRFDMDRSEVVQIVDEYMHALRSGDYSAVRFSSDVRFLGPLMNSPIEGKENVIQLLTEVSEGVSDVRVSEHVIESSKACSLSDFETTSGEVLPILDYFEIGEKGISYIRPFFDPRPLIKE